MGHGSAREVTVTPPEATSIQLRKRALALLPALATICYMDGRKVMLAQLRDGELVIRESKLPQASNEHVRPDVLHQCARR